MLCCHRQTVFLTFKYPFRTLIRSCILAFFVSMPFYGLWPFLLLGGSGLYRPQVYYSEEQPNFFNRSSGVDNMTHTTFWPTPLGHFLVWFSFILLKKMNNYRYDLDFCIFEVAIRKRNFILNK